MVRFYSYFIAMEFRLLLVRLVFNEWSNEIIQDIRKMGEEQEIFHNLKFT